MKHIDWSHKWNQFYLIDADRDVEREPITHALAKHIWDTDFSSVHWSPAAFRIMQEIVLS